MRTRGRVAWLALGALALAGCPASDAGVVCEGPACLTQCLRERGRADAATATGRTLTYVLAAITIDPTDDAMAPHTGFDVDDRWSLGDQPADCSHEDFFSAIDPDQNCRIDATSMDRSCPLARRGCARGSAGCAGGVDNQLPTAANTFETFFGYDQRELIASEIDAGRALLLVRVDGVHDTANDPEVEVALLLAFDADGDCTNNLAGAGRFVVDAASFVDGDATRPRWRGRGSIVNSRVVTCEWFAGVALLPLGRRYRAREVTRAQVRFTLSADGRAVGDGNFGGVALARPWIDDVAAEFADIVSTIDQVEIAASGLVDVELDRICFDRMSRPRRFGGVAVGYGFTGVAATVVGVAPRAPEGACGARGDAGVDAALDAGADADAAVDASTD